MRVAMKQQLLSSGLGEWLRLKGLQMSRPDLYLVMGGSFSVTFHRDTSFPAVGARSGQRCFKRTAADLFTTFPFFHSFARAVVFSWGNRLVQYLPT